MMNMRYAYVCNKVKKMVLCEIICIENIGIKIYNIINQRTYIKI